MYVGSLVVVSWSHEYMMSMAMNSFSQSVRLGNCSTPICFTNPLKSDPINTAYVSVVGMYVSKVANVMVDVASAICPLMKYQNVHVVSRSWKAVNA